MWVIVDTRPDNSVAVTVPTRRLVSAFTGGGFGSLAAAVELPLDEEQRSVLMGSASLPREIEKLVMGGHAPDVARRWVNAIVAGGESEAGAADLIRLRDCSGGRDHARVTDNDVPPDRFFRKAWRRPAGGGPIYVDMQSARTLFARRVIAAKGQRVKELLAEIEIAQVSGDAAEAMTAAHDALMQLDLRVLGALVLGATTPDALAALWPESLK